MGLGILIFQIATLATIAASNVATKDGIRLVEPKEYTVKRFNEVIDDAIKAEEDTTPQEKLIAARARLAVAERRLEDLKVTSISATPGAPVDANDVKAAEARVDHYQKTILALESKILRERQKERTTSKKAAPARKK